MKTLFLMTALLSLTLAAPASAADSAAVVDDARETIVEVCVSVTTGQYAGIDCPPPAYEACATVSGGLG